MIIKDGGDVSVSIQRGKVMMEIRDHGGLDGSPPDGFSIALKPEMIETLCENLREAVQLVQQYQNQNIDRGEEIIRIPPVPTSELD